MALDPCIESSSKGIQPSRPSSARHQSQPEYSLSFLPTSTLSPAFTWIGLRYSTSYFTFDWLTTRNLAGYFSIYGRCQYRLDQTFLEFKHSWHTFQVSLFQFRDSCCQLSLL